jgi:hypothetical protein
MQSFKTKKDLIKNFGLPTQKRQEDTYTEWLYDYGKIGIGSTSNTNTSFLNTGLPNATTANAEYVTIIKEENRFIKFILDENDNVISYTASGVDFTKKKSNLLGTLLITSSVTVGGLVLLILGSQ